MSPYELVGAGPQGTLVLQGDFTVENAEVLKEALTETLKKFEDVSLDLAGVLKVDLSFMQLICSAWSVLKERGKDMPCVSPIPEEVEQLAKDAGFMPGCVDQCFWRRGN